MSAGTSPHEVAGDSPAADRTSVNYSVVDRSIAHDRRGLIDLAADFERRDNPSAAYLCLLRASQLGEHGLGFRLVDLHERSVAQRQIELDGDFGSRPIQGRVSIVMPTRGTSKRINESIRSVIAQTYCDWELIIVNDGGSEHLLHEQLAHFADLRIKYVHRSTSQGPSTARNVGITASSGEWIAYLDDDDVFLPHHLATCVSALRRTGAGLAFSRCHRMFGTWVDDRFQAVTSEPQPWPSGRPTAEMLRCHNFICTLNVLHSRRVLELVGGWDPGIRHLEDWEFWLRLATRVELISVPSFTGHYRIVREPGSSANASVIQVEQMALFEELISAMISDGGGLHRVLADCLAYGQRQRAQRAFEWLCNDAAIHPFGRAEAMRGQLAAIRRGMGAGLLSRDTHTALCKLALRVVLLRLSGIRRRLTTAADRHLKWRIKRLLQ